jgi:hypothetical protein
VDCGGVVILAYGEVGIRIDPGPYPERVEPIRAFGMLRDAGFKRVPESKPGDVLLMENSRATFVAIHGENEMAVFSSLKAEKVVERKFSRDEVVAYFRHQSMEEH